jgi:hypothetical protein
MAEERLFCEDCVYFKPWARPGERQDLHHDRCTNPVVQAAKAVKMAALLGKDLVRRPDPKDCIGSVYCINARLQTGPCGLRGRYFKAKSSITA